MKMPRVVFVSAVVAIAAAMVAQPSSVPELEALRVENAKLRGENAALKRELAAASESEEAEKAEHRSEEDELAGQMERMRGELDSMIRAAEEAAQKEQTKEKPKPRHAAAESPTHGAASVAAPVGEAHKTAGAARANKGGEPPRNLNPATFRADAANGTAGAARANEGGETQRNLDPRDWHSWRAPANRWAAMVINLDRRPERLGRFQKAIQQEEPWLLAKGRLCRIEGRDGQEIKDAALDFSLAQKRVGHAFRRAAFLARPGGFPPLDPVPRSLKDPMSLVSDGWLTFTALAASKAAVEGWPKMTAGGVGLYLGHAAAWQHIVNKKLDCGLIFEDDLTLFAPVFEDTVSALIKKCKEDSPWDMLYLQRCNDEAWKKRRSWEDDENAPPMPDFRADPKVVPIAPKEEVPCTGAYLVTRRGAEKLLSGALPANDQLDFQIGDVSGLRRAALSPPVAQCQEVYKHADGTAYRDTDVQPSTQALMDARADEWLRKRMALHEHRGRAFQQMAKRAASKHIEDCAP